MPKLIETLLQRRVRALLQDRRGQDLVEYALMAGFITVAVAAAFPPVSASICTIFSKIGSLMLLT